MQFIYLLGIQYFLWQMTGKAVAGAGATGKGQGRAGAAGEAEGTGGARICSMGRLKRRTDAPGVIGPTERSILLYTKILPDGRNASVGRISVYYTEIFILPSNRQEMM